jgi:hypothetical protein
MMSDNMLGSDTYRDDRMYVMRITSNFTKDADGAVTVPMRIEGGSDLSKPVVLITYRNTPNLPAVRVDDFPSGREAIDYIMRVEPTCPRVSLGGRPMEPTPTWQEHLGWLHVQGLTSAAEGDAPIPHCVEGESNPRETFMVAQKKPIWPTLDLSGKFSGHRSFGTLRSGVVGQFEISPGVRSASMVGISLAPWVGITYLSK